ncbi:inorganic phosphate transporter [Methyloprofundus sedimenti]|uniref:inorganic phosphate transporter n=1 Tax=Methyloprofundus sedimenti TaxID=1420851 RepID=UPI0018E9F64E|nr:inorganic phosphate transporter [Methyloprofundus sedimenti]
MTEIQQMAYNGALARDAGLRNEEDFDPDELETDYYIDIHNLNAKKEDLAAHRALETYVPIIAALGSMVISAMLIFKGLKNMHLELSTLNNLLIMLMIAASIWMATYIFAKTLKGHSLNKSTFLLFSWMQVFTASGFAFSHGANDIANAIGPFAAILDVLRTGEMGSSAAVPPIAMLTFGVALISGLWFIGKEVIATVGHNLTEMHPASGFSAELAAAAVVLLASMFGIPVSSTHILIGAIMGIGLVNKQANWDLMKPIALAWVITLPAAAILSSLVFLALANIF